MWLRNFGWIREYLPLPGMDKARKYLIKPSFSESARVRGKLDRDVQLQREPLAEGRALRQPQPHAGPLRRGKYPTLIFAGKARGEGSLKVESPKGLHSGRLLGTWL
jgi:hypothetical protein